MVAAGCSGISYLAQTLRINLLCPTRSVLYLDTLWLAHSLTGLSCQWSRCAPDGVEVVARIDQLLKRYLDQVPTSRKSVVRPDKISMRKELEHRTERQIQEVSVLPEV
jgi:hypothetical protein